MSVENIRAHGDCLSDETRVHAYLLVRARRLSLCIPVLDVAPGAPGVLFNFLPHFLPNVGGDRVYLFPWY